MIKKYSLVFIALLCAPFFSFCQEIASFSSANNTACSGIIFNDANITSTGVCRGSGIIRNGGGTYNSRNWTQTGVIDINDYLEWTITPNPGYQINLSTMDIRYDRSNTGPDMAEIQVDDGSGFTTIFTDSAVNPIGENNNGIDLTAFTNIMGSITFRLYAYNATHTNGTFDIEEHTTTNKGLIINGSVTAMTCIVTTTWNGSSWSPSPPDISTNAVINGDYNTGNGGNEVSFSACNLMVNTNYKLTVDNSTYIKVENDVIIDGTITVQTQGTLAQVDDAGTFTLNAGGTAKVIKYTANLNQWYEYTYWSSPVIGETVEDAFPYTPSNRRFWFNAQNYLDATKEVGNNGETKNGQDDIDDDGNDWQLASGAMLTGSGYASTSSPLGMFPSSDQATFIGEFNTGDILVNVYKNDAETKDNNWNLIGNPYPSAISADDFLTENASVLNVAVPINPPIGGVSEGAIYIWSQNTQPSYSNNGNENLNFAQSDYAIINSTSEVAGGDGITPARFIPSGQAFFISYDNDAEGTEISPGSDIKEGTIKFTNSMRMADTNSNDQFFRSNNTLFVNKLWLNLTSDNGVFSQTAVGYVENATNEYDGFSFDASRNLSSQVHSMIYTMIEGEDKKFAIQGKDPTSLTLEEIIPLGFQTSIDVATLYTLSIAQIEGAFLKNNTVFLKDNLSGVIYDLSASDYTFTSEVGEFNNRFEIAFTQDALSLGDYDTNNNSLRIIEHNNGQVQFKLSNPLEMKSIEITDLLGRTIYRLNADGNSKTYNLSNLNQATYIAKVELSNGFVITKKAIKRN